MVWAKIVIKITTGTQKVYIIKLAGNRSKNIKCRLFQWLVPQFFCISIIIFVKNLILLQDEELRDSRSDSEDETVSESEDNTLEESPESIKAKVKIEAANGAIQE